MSERMGFAWLSLCACLAVFAPAAHAGRPMATDDASITYAGQCQAQLWLQHAAGENEFWLLPACSVSNDVEITVGGAEHWSDSRDHETLWSAQLKFPLRAEAPGDWGAAFSVGWNHRESTAIENRVNAQPVNFVTTYLANDQSYAVHLNLGARHDAEEDSTQATWGAAYEHAPSERFGEFVEIFGISGSAPSFQTNLRYDLVPDRVSVNCTAGAVLRDGLHEPFVTVGLNVFPGPSWPLL